MPHEAGRQTDALVAEKVIGLTPWPGVKGAFHPPQELSNLKPAPTPARYYSTDMGAAWQVATTLAAGGCDVAIFTTDAARRDKGQWTCVISSGARRVSASADSAPLAICRAALAFVGVS